jgi:ribosomal protein L7/L12
MPRCQFCDQVNEADAPSCKKCGAPLGGMTAHTDSSGQVSEATEAVPPETDSLEAEILALMQDCQKIEAIKLYRQRAGVDLKQAKDFVEALAARHGIQPSKGGCASVFLLMLAFGATTLCATFLLAVLR